MYSYKLIADYFISLSNETQNLITNLKLQKLLYYAQVWSLAINKKRLFEGDFEAWVHGPVLVALYNDYKDNRANPIRRDDLGEGKFSEILLSFDSTTQALLKDVTDNYFGLTAYELERRTHQEEPWRKARKGLEPDEPSSEKIDDVSIIEFYSQLVIE